MSYFLLEEHPIKDESVHLAYSYDGLTWTALNNGEKILDAKTGTGRARDPYLFRLEDDSFAVVATEGWAERSIYLWQSVDLVTWSSESLITVNDLTTNDNTAHAWAPEVIFDPKTRKYNVYWSGRTTVDGTRGRTYYNTTTDFKTFSSPALYFDAGFDQIDATIHYYNNKYYLYYKDERETSSSSSGKTILSATSSSVDANSFTSQISTSLSTAKSEGATVFKLNNENKWYMYYDFFGQETGDWKTSYFGLNYTTDLNSTDTNFSNTIGWTPVSSTGFSKPFGAKHPTVIPVTYAELAKVKTAWPSTAVSFGGTRSGNVTEDTALTASGTITVSDSAPLKAQTLTGAYGSLVITSNSSGGGSWSYTLNNGNSAVQGLVSGGTLTDSFTTVSTVDGASSTTVTITINGSNDSATISGTSTGSVTEDAAPNTIIRTLTVSDADSGQNSFQIISTSSNYGIFVMSGVGTWSYTLDNSKSAVQALASGATYDDKFTVTSYDGSARQTVTITIYGSDDYIALTGTAGADTLTGSSQQEIISGLGGNDNLKGEGNNDILIGGGGADTLSGGSGADIFIYTSIDDSSFVEQSDSTANRDTIKDFTQGTDKIDLSAIDANTTISGNQAFTGLSPGGNTTSYTTGVLYWWTNQYNETILIANVDSDSTIELYIRITGSISLTTSDFNL
jgi:VCBS repeat-containing protein